MAGVCRSAPPAEQEAFPAVSWGYTGREGQAAPRSLKQDTSHLYLSFPKPTPNPSCGTHDGHSNSSTSDSRPAIWPCSRNTRGARAPGRQPPGQSYPQPNSHCHRSEVLTGLAPRPPCPTLVPLAEQGDQGTDSCHTSWMDSDRHESRVGCRLHLRGPDAGINSNMAGGASPLSQDQLKLAVCCPS